MEPLRRGILVAFEGIDGAGKTTQAGLLEAHLQRVGIVPVRTKEPTNGSFGKRLRQSAFRGRLSPEEELETFIADRKEHVENVVRPALDAGRFVIIDRYYFSTAAYQGARGFDPVEIIKDNEAFAPRPDILVLLEIDSDTAMERIKQRGGVANEFEQKDYLQRCAEVFSGMHGDYILRTNGTNNLESIHFNILRAIDQGPLFRSMCFKDYLEACEPEYCSYRINGQCAYPLLDLARSGPDIGKALLEELAANESLTTGQKIDLLRRAAER